MAINKCDTWDDGEPAPFHNWGREEEENYTTLRHCGRLVIDFGCPSFDLLYQKDFRCRLQLSRAVASLKAETTFSKVEVSSFLSSDPPVLVIDCQADCEEKYSPSVLLERWGSRVFGHWYSLVVRDPSRGLGGTETTIERNRVVIRQDLRSMSFFVVAHVLPDNKSIYPCIHHNRAGAFEIPSSEKFRFTVLVTVVTSENDPDPLAKAHAILDEAVAMGKEAIRERHEEEWREFWSKSMVDLPDKYLENYWYLNLYLANSSMRGAYPPHFCNGLWGWNRDFLPWVYYFHWNEQWLAWPLQAANHPELAQPYLKYRREQLPLAVKYASEVMNKPGAFYADVAERRGYNDLGSDHLHTPGAQIALDFWRQYVYTRDGGFLADSAWPVIREVTRFNAACLVMGEDGHYHIHKTSAYEGGTTKLDDTITDLAMIRGLFPVAIRVGEMLDHDASEIGKWKDMLDRLSPFTLVELDPSEFDGTPDGRIHRGGLGDGKTLESDRVFAVGKHKGEWIRKRYATGIDRNPAVFPDPEIVTVFPSGVIGLADSDSDLFRAAVTQLRLHPSADSSDDGRGIKCMGWCPYPIALARLGLSEELATELGKLVATWQFYPQGFGHYGPYTSFKRTQEARWNRNQVRDAAGSEDNDSRFSLPTWPFRHFDCEAMSIVCCAINELLLQSHDGTIRVFPAVPGAWDVRIDLMATGGFRVKAERKGGRTLFVSIESTLSGNCRVEHPWPGEDLAVLDLTSESPTSVRFNDDSLSFETSSGHRYLMVRNEGDLTEWEVSREDPQPRSTPRALGNAKLGTFRNF